MTTETTDDRRSNAVTRFGNWAFRSRASGEIVFVQWPNAPLVAFLVARSVMWFLQPSTLLTAVSALATAALVIWSADEIFRGVNPWRRFLGGAVLAATLASLVMRLRS